METDIAAELDISKNLNNTVGLLIALTVTVTLRLQDNPSFWQLVGISIAAICLFVGFFAGFLQQKRFAQILATKKTAKLSKTDTMPGAYQFTGLIGGILFLVFSFIF